MSTFGEGISILILGASVMQIPAIRIGRELGWRVVVADANPRAPGIPLADGFEHVDLRDRDGMTDAARRQKLAGGLDGVFTAGTDFSATVAWVAEKLDLPGIPYETALDASDKSRMRAVFAKAGLPSPRFRALSPDDDPLSVLKELQFPLVVKPVDNMGSRGVRRIDAPADIAQAVGDAHGHSRSGRVIVEEFIDGHEFSLDAIIYAGEIQLCGIADRHIYFPPYFVEMGHTMPSNFPKRDQERVIELFFDGIRALGISHGAAKGDIKLSESGPVIGEIAARLSGGYMSGWTYPYSSGIRVTEAAMRVAVGLKPGDLEPKKRLTAAERAFISIPGRVRSVTGVEDIRDGVAELFLRVGPGSEVTFPSNNIQKCGNVICLDSDRGKATERARQACRDLTVRLEPFDRRTSEFLFRNSNDWAPDAFRLGRTANRASFAGMPPFYGPAGAPLGGIVPLPEIDAESATDWYGSTLREAFARLIEIVGLETYGATEIPPGEIILGSLFWRAFLRGGVQGGLWLIDCAMEIGAASDPKWKEILLWYE